MKRIRNIPSGAVVAALLALLLAAVSLSDSLVLGQTEMDPRMRAEDKIVRPDDILDEMNDLDNTFFVQTSSQAEELAVKIRNAARLESERKWSEAAVEYDAILRVGDSSLAAMPGIDGERVYLGLKEYCRRRLKQFPAQGVVAYRMMVDGKARERLVAALENMDETAIREIVANYPISGWADEALWYLANVLYERADFHEAMYYYKRLFEEFDPDDVSVSLPAAYIKFAVCAREIGCSTASTLMTCLKNLPADIAAKKVRVYDEATRRYVSVTVRDYLEETSRILNAGVSDRFSGLEIEPEKFRHMDLAWRSLQVRSNGGYDACVWRDRIYASLMGLNITMADYRENDILALGSRHAEGRVLGYDIDTGKLVFRGHKYSALDKQGAEARGYFPSTVTVDESSVYFVDYDYRAMPGGSQPPQVTPMGVVMASGRGCYVSELHACDKETGKIKWAQPWEVNNVGNRGGVDPDKAREFLNDMCITSVPVRYGAYLYATVVRSLPEANEIYAACFNAANGALMWYSHIGGETFLGTGSYGRKPELGSRMTVVDNMVYFSTNMGVAGCASAETGDLLWVAKYRVKTDMKGNPNSFSNPAVAEVACVWNATAPRVARDIDVIVRGKTIRTDLMLVAPRDSDTIYAYDALTGKRLWERNIDIGFSTKKDLPRRWINYTDKHVFIVQQIPSDGIPDKYNPRRLTVLEVATGREIDFPKLVSEKNGKGILASDRDIVQVRPYVCGRLLVLLTRTDLYCFDSENGYALVADVKVALAEDEDKDKDILSTLTDMALQGTKIFFMGPDRIACYELSGGE